MFYKTNWKYRLHQETEKWKIKYPNYQLVVSNSERMKNYSKEEIEEVILLKRKGFSDKHIAKSIGRSYWSIVYKLSELRKKDLL